MGVSAITLFRVAYTTGWPRGLRYVIIISCGSRAVHRRTGHTGTHAGTHRLGSIRRAKIVFFFFITRRLSGAGVIVFGFFLRRAIGWRLRGTLLFVYRSHYYYYFPFFASKSRKRSDDKSRGFFFGVSKLKTRNGRRL